MELPDGRVSHITNEAHPTEAPLCIEDDDIALGEPHTWRAMSSIKLPSNEEEANNDSCSDMVIGLVDGSFHIDTMTNEGLFGDNGIHDLKREWMGGTNAKFPVNKKIVGAKQFSDDNKKSQTWKGDNGDHGSACAAIACGNYVPANYFGISKGIMRGSAPKAKVALYQCHKTVKTGKSSPKSVVAALLAAVDDRVDVLSISMGHAIKIPDKTSSYRLSAVGKGTLVAALEEIVCCSSSGNSGGVVEASNTEPWQLCVGACSNSKGFCTEIRLGNDTSIKAHSTNLFKGTGWCSLAYADDVSEPSIGSSSTAKLVLARKKVKGKILYCKSRCDPKNDDGRLHRKAGVKGIIYLDTLKDNLSDKYILDLPAASVQQNDFDIIEEYCKSELNPVAEILPTVEVDDDDRDCPVLLSFSSKGPNSRAFDIVKPDICAPGILLVPSSPPLKAIVKNGVQKSSLYRIMHGTSASAPLVAGGMAFLKSIHPKWSAAALKSAVMTTADEMRIKSDEDMLGVGSGVLNVEKAQDPGLVYDIEPMDYLHYLHGRKFYFPDLKNDSEDRLITELVEMAMKEKKEIHPRDLNLPNLGASFEDNERTWTFRRRLKNVGSPNSTYLFHVREKDGLVIEPVPRELYFENLEDIQNYELKVEVTDWKKGGKYGFRTYIEWQCGAYKVRSYVVIIKSSAIHY